MKISNWGNYPIINTDFREPSGIDEIAEIIKNTDTVIPRGNGRCYGDASLAETTISLLKLNQIISIDPENRLIECMSGVLLSDILSKIVPLGMFLPVTPGTKFITLGGAIAADIHGKNHHKLGSISEHILSFSLLTQSGKIENCSPTENSQLFYSTFGGMGLTGIIISARMKLIPIQTSYIRQKAIKARNLTELFSLFDEYRDYTYSVAWIDSLAKGKSMGKSVLLLGEHAIIEELSPKQQRNKLKTHSDPKFNVPFTFPSFILNNMTMKLFNFLFYNKQLAHETNNCIHYDPYFYPLDIAHNWNRIYGKAGFLQYQFVIPEAAGKQPLIKLFNEISQSRFGSFLTVLKEFGDGNPLAINSFPTKGYTFAMDIKLVNGVLPFLDMIDKIVTDCGGRIYLAKDARLKSTEFTKQYPNFLETDSFKSYQYQRLHPKI